MNSRRLLNGKLFALSLCLLRIGYSYMWVVEGEVGEFGTDIRGSQLYVLYVELQISFHKNFHWPVAQI